MSRFFLCWFYLFSTVPALASKPVSVEWTMVNVNAGDAQADAHLLKFPDGQVDFIDVGDPGHRLPTYLKGRGITVIDRIIISHPHKDHYDGLIPLLESGVRIERGLYESPRQGDLRQGEALGLRLR